MLDGMSDSIQGSRIENLHSREVDRQSPKGLIFDFISTFLFHVKSTISVFSGLAESPWSLRHLSFLCNAACNTSQTVLKSIPSTSIEKSANPCVKYPAEFNIVNKLSATRIHIRAESTPPCGKP